MMITFEPLFTFSRVLSAVYRIISTILLLIYLAHAVMSGRRYRRMSKSSAMRTATHEAYVG